MKRDKCEFCDGVMERRRVLARFRFKGETIYVDHAPAWVCNKCSEQYFDAPVYKHLEEIARQRARIRKTISFPLAEFDMVTA
ncbi:MAG: YgiT-type zinc finger protein [Candidatus Omnitrophica bacterium]|nr:YgiT-type zinc finger protein [Candidatus Omnitrophota bacterium]